jgi:hypothetical protein
VRIVYKIGAYLPFLKKIGKSAYKQRYVLCPKVTAK